jgi:hypothetical protein
VRYPTRRPASKAGPDDRGASGEWREKSGQWSAAREQWSVVSGQKMRREVTGGDSKVSEQSRLLRVLIAGGLSLTANKGGIEAKSKPILGWWPGMVASGDGTGDEKSQPRFQGAIRSVAPPLHLSLVKRRREQEKRGERDRDQDRDYKIRNQPA